MEPIRILLVDNDPDYLASCTPALEGAGYSVLHASGVDDALRALDERLIHLVILDVRLVDDSDDKDLSGLKVARHGHASIPKIILTRYPSVSMVREALGRFSAAEPLAVSFVDKREGLDVLLHHIDAALGRRLINPLLRVDWNAVDRIALVTRLIGVSAELLVAERTAELEDLFRSLFHDKSQVQLGRLLWQLETRAAVLAYTFASNRQEEAVVIVLGARDSVLNETDRFVEFAPRAARAGVPTLFRSSETARLGANVYHYLDIDLDRLRPLSDVYREPEKIVLNTLERLFDTTLTYWHEMKRMQAHQGSPRQVSWEGLDPVAGKDGLRSFSDTLQALSRRATVLGIELTVESGRVTLKLGDHLFSYPDPTLIVGGKFWTQYPVVMLNSPGQVDSRSVFVDSRGRSCLTDFAMAGPAPAHWNLVSLEADIRFDWTEETDLNALREMDEMLAGEQFSKFPLGDLAHSLRKAARAIQVIRRMAQLVNPDPLPYYYGLIWQMMYRLPIILPKAALTTSELSRRVRRVVAAAIAASRISDLRAGSADSASVCRGIQLDGTTRTVRVDGVRVHIGGQGYELLQYLYEHAGQLCTRRALIEHVLQEGYDPTNRSQSDRLNTAVNRLREQLGIQFGIRGYLKTEPGLGYLLRATVESTEPKVPGT